MDSESFKVAIRALRVKRRAFAGEITSLIRDAQSDEGLSKETFYEKKDYIEHCWEEIVTSMKDCVGLIDDVEKKGEMVDNLNENLESLQYRMEKFWDPNIKKFG